MILKWNKVIRLCLESFSSSNLTHFHLEHRKSNQNRNDTWTEWKKSKQNWTICEQNGKGQNFNLANALSLRLKWCSYYDVILLNVFAPSFWKGLSQSRLNFSATRFNGFLLCSIYILFFSIRFSFWIRPCVSLFLCICMYHFWFLLCFIGIY